MNKFQVKLLSFDKNKKVKILKDLGNENLDFSIPKAMGRIKKSVQWEDIVIRIMIARTLGKEQKYVKLNRTKNDIEEVEKYIWNGGSIVMHYFDFVDKDWVAEWVKDICLAVDNNETINSVPDFNNTLELIESLITFINANQIDGVTSEPIKNMLNACKVRIIFESLHSLGEAFKRKEYKNIWNRKSKSNWTKKEIQFENKYSYIYNNLAHSIENASFYYISINAEFLNDSMNAVLKLKTDLQP
ncbi:hypothetical protein [Mycoplasma todarodis]|uniref:hypothetical protein n=1 Tax=Mycoplasma todarodis TaxID=1937191 RepID=UPI003B38B05B